jgi:hypothetical protein
MLNRRDFLRRASGVLVPAGVMIVSPKFGSWFTQLFRRPPGWKWDEESGSILGKEGAFVDYMDRALPDLVERIRQEIDAQYTGGMSQYIQILSVQRPSWSNASQLIRIEVPYGL